MGIADGRGLPAWLVSCQPACGLLKHAVQVAHPRAPIGSWPPADPSLAVTPTDATGRQDRLSPRMGQLILLWPSWHLLGTTPHCLTTLTVSLICCACRCLQACCCHCAVLHQARRRLQYASFRSTIRQTTDPAVPAKGLDHSSSSPRYNADMLLLGVRLFSDQAAQEVR